MVPNEASCLEARAALFAEGDPTGDVYELVAGVVRLSKVLPDGRRQIVGFAFPGEIFTSSGFALSKQNVATCTADAVTPVRVVVYPQKGLHDLLLAQPDFVHSMFDALRHSLLHAQQQMVLLGRMSAVERLVWFLLMMAEKQNVEHNVPLHLPMPRYDIADYLGITHETVSRVLSRLRKNQLIEIQEGSMIRIRDWAVMRRMVEGLC